MLTYNSAANYIASIKKQQAKEQMQGISFRQRGLKFSQKVSNSAPFMLYLLDTNQVNTILEDDKRDKIIDYLIN